MSLNPASKVACIINPASGSFIGPKLKDMVLEGLSPTKYSVDFFETNYPGHATEISVQLSVSEYDIILICGGDGTINESLQGLVKTNKTIAILPSGSGNGISMHAGIGRDAKTALAFINNGNTKSIDAIQAGNRIIINLAGVGFDALIAKQLKLAKYRGYWAYVGLIMKYFWRFKSSKYEMVIDGVKRKERLFMIEIANGPMYGYDFNVVPGADMSDGLITVLLLKEASIFRRLLDVPKIINGNLDQVKWAEQLLCKQISISRKRKLSLHIDGEYVKLKDKKISFDIIPNAFNLIVP